MICKIKRNRMLYLTLRVFRLVITLCAYVLVKSEVKGQQNVVYALFINGGRAVETWAEFTKTRLRRQSQETLASKKEGVLDQKENKLNPLSFQTKRKWRNDGCRPYAEMLVNFFAFPGHQKACSLCISSLLAYRRVYTNVSVPSIFAWKQTSPRKRPPLTERPYQRHWKVGEICPRKRSFSVSSEPSCSKTPETASDNSVISLNLFGVANQMWSVCAFLCNIQDPRHSTKSFRQLICNFYDVQCFGGTSVCW